MSDSRQRDQWTSRLGVILAVAGSAVGLGNFLRFPGVASSNGGGAFMIPYFCALIFLGIPIGWAEWAMGRYGGSKGYHSAPAIMGLFGKGRAGRYVGVIGVMIPLAVYFYYILIESWTLAYTWNFIRGGIGINLADPVTQQVQTSKNFFVGVTGMDIDGIIATGGGLHQSVVFWAIVFALNVWFVYRGLAKGIEAFCKWAMPLMAVCGLIVLARVLTLGTPDPTHPDQNVLSGLGFMWNPNFSALADFKTWLAAAGQIFFSLSVGFGVIINYASYVSKRNDIVLSGLTASATNEFFEVALGGLITIPAAVVFLGIGLTSTSTGTFNLGFNTLPVVFAHMPLGNVFGATFFFMLFLAAITSSLSMLQPAKAFFEEALNVGKKESTVIVTGISLIGSMFVIWFSKDLAALDTIDFWVGTFLIFLMASLQIIFFSWVFGLENGIREAEYGAEMRIPKLFHFVMKYVSPTYLLVVFVGFCIQQLPGYASSIGQNTVVQYTLLLLVVVFAVLVLVTRKGEMRWLGAAEPSAVREKSVRVKQ